MGALSGCCKCAVPVSRLTDQAPCSPAVVPQDASSDRAHIYLVHAAAAAEQSARLAAVLLDAGVVALLLRQLAHPAEPLTAEEVGKGHALVL